MGSQFAIEAALQQPGRVSQLVLMGPVVDSKRRTVMQQALALGRDSLFFESPSSNALVFTDYLRCGPVWYLKTLRVMMGYPTEQKIPGVSAPVLVLRGANDPVASADWCRRLAAHAAEGQTARNRRHRARGAAQPLRGSGGSHPGLCRDPPDGRGGSPGTPGMSGVLRVLQTARWWVQDYLYAAGRQVLSAVSRTRPEDFLGGTGRPVVVIPGSV